MPEAPAAPTPAAAVAAAAPLLLPWCCSVGTVSGRTLPVAAAPAPPCCSVGTDAGRPGAATRDLGPPTSPRGSCRHRLTGEPVVGSGRAAGVARFAVSKPLDTPPPTGPATPRAAADHSLTAADAGSTAPALAAEGGGAALMDQRREASLGMRPAAGLDPPSYDGSSAPDLTSIDAIDPRLDLCKPRPFISPPPPPTLPLLSTPRPCCCCDTRMGTGDTAGTAAAE